MLEITSCFSVGVKSTNKMQRERLELARLQPQFNNPLKCFLCEIGSCLPVLQAAMYKRKGGGAVLHAVFLAALFPC